MSKSKLSAFLSLLLVFLSGTLVGAVAHRLYTVGTVFGGTGVNRHGPGRRPDPEEVRKRIVEETREKVKLDDQQVAKLNQLYDEERTAFDQLHKKRTRER